MVIQMTNSPHFDDQMEIYLNFKTKKMQLNIREIFKNAIKIYNLIKLILKFFL